jgi:tripartite-type tricarboxylate transporter receptor subunit TctC
MNPLTRRTLLKATGTAALACVAPAALAQEKFPARPITLICPWPPGGSSDAVIRAFAESASRALGGASIVVENRPGAGGTLGAAAMVTAKPDGYTLTQLPLGIYRIPHMQKTAFDPVKDLTHIICLTGYTFGIVVPADSPFKTLEDMIKAAKAQPGKINYGHTGIGTTPHLAIEEFAAKAGIELNHIPYKGSAEILQAILGGQLMMMSGTTEFAPHVESGRLRMLATLGRARTKRFPNVPTVKDLGYDTITESPFGFGGPKGMDPAVVRTLHDAFRKTLDDPKVLEILGKFDMPTVYMNTEEYTAYAARTFAAERATMQRLGLLKG